MEPNRLEQEFRDKLEQRTIEPSKMAWDRLDAMLSVNEGKEEKKVIAVKTNRNWMYMAASFVVFATIGAFFLTREHEGGKGRVNNSTSVVTTENPAQQNSPDNNNNPGTEQPVIAQPAGENITAPKMGQDAVATTTHTSGKSNIYGKVQEHEDTAVAYVPEPTVHTAPKPLEPVAIADNGQAEKLLAAATPQASKTKPSIKVDAGSLLSSVEGELDESFRDKALQGVIKNFNAVKTSVANRNYQ